MLKAVVCGTSLMLAALAAVSVHGQSLEVEFANLREDVRGLSQRVSELQLRVEQLERENNDLRARSASSAQGYATVAQLNEAIADMNQAAKAAAAASKNEALQQVSAQMEKLAKQTNAAIESLARSAPAGRSSSVTTNFSDDFSKEGITYTVQKGDTIALIAKKTGASARDIVNANKISDPSLIQIGQTLFIPGGK